MNHIYPNMRTVNLGYQLIEVGIGEVEETLKQAPWNPSIVAAEVNYDLNSFIF